jgi:hypothetical protein
MERGIIVAFVSFITVLIPKLRYRITELSVRRFLNLPPAGHVFVDGQLCRLVSRSEAAFRRQNMAALRRGYKNIPRAIRNRRKES